MCYSVFPVKPNDATKEPMWFGENVNVSRYDKQKYIEFEQLIEKQLSFFWRPEEVDVSKDAIDFNSKLSEAEQHIFTSNLKYQTLLDSVQGRAPNVAFLPLCSLPELETWIETWSFSETIHSRSYTHIIRNIYNDPSIVFDDIMVNKHILERAIDVGKYYDELIELVNMSPSVKSINIEKYTYQLYKALYLCLMSVNILEAIRFYASFCCSFSFAENALMEGNAKIIKLIARDEALHLTGTQFILNTLASGKEGELWYRVADDSKDAVIELFKKCSEQELDWCDYLFSKGSMLGLNNDILKDYVKYITNVRMDALNLPKLYPNNLTNPVPWMNNWLISDHLQVAPQETEISSYLVGQIDSTISNDDFSDMEL